MFNKLLNKIFKRTENETKQVNNQHKAAEDAMRIDLLDRLENKKDLSALPDCYWFLLEGDSNTKLRIVEALNSIIESQSISLLPRIDFLCRDRSSLEWFYDWKNEDPNNLLDSVMSDEQKAIVIGVASFHPNGYFREKALNILMEMNKGCEMPYLLLRMNDWVHSISYLAKKAVIERLNIQNINVIVDNLPLIMRLENCSHNEHKDILDITISLLKQKEAEEALKYGISSKDINVRKYCYEIIVQNAIWDTTAILNCLIKELNPQIRLRTLRNTEKRIDPEIFKSYAVFLLRDKYAPVRSFALEIYNRFYPSESHTVLEKAILDENISIRETARFLMSKECTYDFADIYRNILSENNACIGAILGLGETGSNEDAVYVVPFLDDVRVKVVRATVKSLSKLDFEEVKSTLIDMLADPRPGVSKEVRRILKGKINALDAERIYEIYKSSSLNHIKKNAAILLFSLSKWDAIKYILELNSDTDEDIDSIAKSALKRWKLKFNRSFISPTIQQKLAVERTLEKYGQHINIHDREWIKFTN